ncbi:NADase-type glycan-binding domain-containing protein, partial [Streptomyces sp. NPDC004285]
TPSTGRPGGTPPHGAPVESAAPEEGVPAPPRPSRPPGLAHGPRRDDDVAGPAPDSADGAPEPDDSRRPRRRDAGPEPASEAGQERTEMAREGAGWLRQAAQRVGLMPDLPTVTPPRLPSVPGLPPTPPGDSRADRGQGENHGSRQADDDDVVESASSSSAPSARPGSQPRAADPPAPVRPGAPTPPPRPRSPASPPAPAGGSPGPVLPAKAVAARPVVRQAPVDEDAVGAPCPACGTPNAPGRNFCRRCAAPLTSATAPDRLPWWRTVWPFRRRVRSGSGRFARFLTVLVVVLALCAGGFLLLPAGRALIEDTRDKLGKAKPVTATGVRASAELPGHEATETTDGLSNRYWGAPRSGASVTYRFAKPFRMVDVIVTNGASADPEAYASQGRALRIEMEVTSKDGEVVRKTLNLSDKPGPQTFPTGISDVLTVRLALESPVGLTGGRHLAVSEVEFFQRG